MIDAFEIVAYKLHEPIWNNFEIYYLFYVKYDIPSTSECYSADILDNCDQPLRRLKFVTYQYKTYWFLSIYAKIILFPIHFSS